LAHHPNEVIVPGDAPNCSIISSIVSMLVLEKQVGRMTAVEAPPPFRFTRWILAELNYQFPLALGREAASLRLNKSSTYGII
jgi:hypothetical protein